MRALIRKTFIKLASAVLVNIVEDLVTMHQLYMLEREYHSQIVIFNDLQPHNCKNNNICVDWVT